ncbi:MAG: DUF429 domain-containing protein [Saprospiraceae bacterium]|nr:DUF429 domain-containing protein [Saprospiraceae bacterium]MCB9324987.1 DUF429 domain-containing protein [Lewinellaceae bacterium]
MAIAGVDGCKKGWLMIKYDNDRYTYAVHENFTGLIGAHSDLQRIFIDIPIGLSSDDFIRTVESSLRKELPGRQSTVFNPPCREALKFTDYESAKSINQKTEGKSLSIQSFFISSKIKEVDDFLLKGNRQLEIYESHPELCFKYLNPPQQVLLTKKSKNEGIKDRLAILEKYDPEISPLYHDILGNTQRKDVKKDDIVDAICLCLANRLAGPAGLSFIKDKQARDDAGIDIKIAYYKLPLTRK